MIRCLALEHSVDASPPSLIDQLVRQHGLVRDDTVYRLESGSQQSLDDALDRLCVGLKGTESRYLVTEERPSPRRVEQTSGAEVMRWVVDEWILDLLDKDPERFHQEALRRMSDAVDQVLDRRRDEVEDKGFRRSRDAAMEEVLLLLRTSAERTFQEILDTIDMDTAILEAVLKEMIERVMVGGPEWSRSHLSPL